MRHADPRTVYALKGELGVSFGAILARLDELGYGSRGWGMSRPLPDEAVDALRSTPRALLDDLEGFTWRTAPDVVTTAEAAQLARVSATVIRQWVARGHLVADGKRGRSATFRKSDVQTCASQVNARKNSPKHPYSHDVPEDTLLTVPEISRLTQVAQATVRSWIHRGQVPVIGRNGSSPLVRVGDLSRIKRLEM